MKRFAVVILAATALLVSPAATAPSIQNGQLVEPLKRILDDDVNREQDLAYAIQKNKVGELFSGAIFSHASRYMDLPTKAVPLIDYFTSHRVVTADGRMASIFYHEQVKDRLGGDARLLRGQYIAWQEQYPDSAVPIVFTASNMLSAHASPLREALVSLAPVEGVEFDRAKVDEVRTYLLTNKAKGSKDPYWYNLMVETQIFLRVSEAELKSTVAEGLTLYPENIDLPVLAASYYFTKWGGVAAKLDGYAKWVVSQSPGKGRANAYPRIYNQALRGQYGLTLFKLVSKDWPLMTRGVEHLMAAYPDKGNRAWASVLTCLAGDRALTRTLMAVDDFNTNLTVWIDRDAKSLCRNWARS